VITIRVPQCGQGRRRDGRRDGTTSLQFVTTSSTPTQAHFVMNLRNSQCKFVRRTNYVQRGGRPASCFWSCVAMSRSRIRMGIPSRQRFGKEAASGAGEAQRRIALPGTPTKQLVFGMDHRVACSKCGQDTYLRRRIAEGNTYETQSFACRACKSLTTRIVDSAGRPLT
jgi:hypothetical protein